MRALLLAVVLLAACAPAEEPPPPASLEGESVAEPGVPCVPPSPLAAPPVPPPPVALPPGSVLVDVSEQAGQRLVSGRVEATVEQVLAHFRTDPSYVVTRDEDEGRAGRLQLFGARGDVAVTVAELTCPAGLTGFTVATAVTEPSPAP